MMMMIMWLFIGGIITNWRVENDESAARCLSLKPLYDNLQLLLLTITRRVMGEKRIGVVRGSDLMCARLNLDVHGPGCSDPTWHLAGGNSAFNDDCRDFLRSDSWYRWVACRSEESSNRCYRCMWSWIIRRRECSITATGGGGEKKQIKSYLTNGA